MGVESKICLSLGNLTFEEAMLQLQSVSLAEIRMDLLDFTEEQFQKIFQSHSRLIATYRAPRGKLQKMASMLCLAVGYGSAYVDIDIQVPASIRNRMASLAHTRGAKVILSYHNFESTPNSNELERIAQSLFDGGADLAKMVCMALSTSDCNRMQGLYSKYNNMVAFCMGPLGRESRLTATLLGAPFTYAAVSGKETAPGQLTFDEVYQFLRTHKPS